MNGTMTRERRASLAHAIVLPLFMGLCLHGTGCATSVYVSDRLADAADIATLTIGYGVGAKVRVGVAQVAIIKNSDAIGLRSGEFFYEGLDLLYNDELYVLPFPLPRGNRGAWWALPFGYEHFSHGGDTMSQFRRKDVRAVSPLPFLTFGRELPFYTQIEVAGGLGLTGRVGVNPGELLDFILGFFFLDIYQDDWGNTRRRVMHVIQQSK